jgi:hypothetical protein
MHVTPPPPNCFYGYGFNSLTSPVWPSRPPAVLTSVQYGTCVGFEFGPLPVVEGFQDAGFFIITHFYAD